MLPTHTENLWTSKVLGGELCVAPAYNSDQWPKSLFPHKSAFSSICASFVICCMAFSISSSSSLDSLHSMKLLPGVNTFLGRNLSTRGGLLSLFLWWTSFLDLILDLIPSSRFTPSSLFPSVLPVFLVLYFGPPQHALHC